MKNQAIPIVLTDDSESLLDMVGRKYKEMHDGAREMLSAEWGKAPALTAISVRTVPGAPTVLIAELAGREVGRMSITHMPLVHDMAIEAGILQRKVAEALFFYACGYTKASGFTEALVLVGEENVAMQRYVETRAIPEEASKVYVMGVQ